MFHTCKLTRGMITFDCSWNLKKVKWWQYKNYKARQQIIRDSISRELEEVCRNCCEENEEWDIYRIPGGNFALAITYLADGSLTCTRLRRTIRRPVDGLIDPSPRVLAWAMPRDPTVLGSNTDHTDPCTCQS